MASHFHFQPPAACSEISSISSVNNRIPFRPNFDPLRRIPCLESSSLLRISVVAISLPPAAQDNPAPFEARPQNHVARLLSSTSTVFMPPVSVKKLHLTDQHLLVTTVCLAGSAMAAFFIAAIPTLLAFKRAAESLEKLLEVTREELPGTMAAVRLSGMEISDLTMELSDLGQEISSGVKSSARAVRAAQDGFRRMSSVASMGARSSSSRANEARSGTNSKGSS